MSGQPQPISRCPDQQQGEVHIVNTKKDTRHCEERQRRGNLLQLAQVSKDCFVPRNDHRRTVARSIDKGRQPTITPPTGHHP
jgi:hypothetical protein